MTDSIPPITEDDIAEYLSNTPEFFSRHAQTLAAVQLTSPHGNRAVSLQERQAEMLREKIRGLERRIMDMVRHGNENVVIADRLHRWACELMRVETPSTLPETMARAIESQFMVPQAAIRVWDVAPVHRTASFATGVGEDVRSFASSLDQPYCGVNSGFEALKWLADPATALSVALIPLRALGVAASEGVPARLGPAFGMLVLASPDPQRFQAGMGTDFLERLADLAGAALSRLQGI